MEEKSAESMISAATGYRLLLEGFDPYCHQAVTLNGRLNGRPLKKVFPGLGTAKT